jgi:hypothetical protein
LGRSLTYTPPQRPAWATAEGNLDPAGELLHRRDGPLASNASRRDRNVCSTRRSRVPCPRVKTTMPPNRRFQRRRFAGFSTRRGRSAEREGCRTARCSRRAAPHLV